VTRTTTAYNLGYSSLYDGDLTIDNWGNWIVTDSHIILQFCNIQFNHYGGWFKSTYSFESNPRPTIIWYNSDVFFGIGADVTAFNGPVEFYSTNTISPSGYAASTPSRVVFDTPGLIISNALFNGVDILFNYDGWIRDSNITNFSTLNGTENSFAIAYLTGEISLQNTFLVTGISQFQVIIEDGAKVSLTSNFGLLGNLLFINNGTLIYNSRSDLYWDATATWVNLGLLEVINYDNDYIRGSVFPGLYEPTNVGTLINRGTIQFTSGGGFYYFDGTGKFLQCNQGVMKYGYGTPTSESYPSLSRFAEIAIDGYIAVYIDEWTQRSFETLFSWQPGHYKNNTKKMWFGSVTLLTRYHYIPKSPQILCFDPSAGYGYLYATDDGLCYPPYVPVANRFISGDACSRVSHKIMKMIPSCPVGANCGLDTGIPNMRPSPQPEPLTTDEDDNNKTPSKGVVIGAITASLCIIVLVLFIFGIYKLRSRNTRKQTTEMNGAEYGMVATDEPDLNYDSNQLVPIYIEMTNKGNR
jgi:hypothetical protein